MSTAKEEGVPTSETDLGPVPDDDEALLSNFETDPKQVLTGPLQPAKGDWSPRPSLDDDETLPTKFLPDAETDVAANEPWGREAEARRQGYSWPEIKDYIGNATATALQHGYTGREIDDFLGRKDPAPFEARARAGWLGSMAGDPSLLETIEPAASPTMREDYAAALLDGEVRGPEDFAYRYTAAALDAAHNGLGLDDTNAQAVRQRQTEGAFAADALAAGLPSREDLIDATLALAAGDREADHDQVRGNLMDHWLATGQDPARAAMQAQNDPDLANKLTETPPVDRTPPLAAFTDPAVEFFKGFAGQLGGDALSAVKLLPRIEQFLGEVTGNAALQQGAVDDLAAFAAAEARMAASLAPNEKDASTFIGRVLGGSAAAVAEFMAFRGLGTGALWAIHGADVAYRETDSLAAAAVGAVIHGAAAFVPFHLLMGGQGFVQNAVKGVAAMSAMGGVQAFLDPLPGVAAGHEYVAPTLDRILENVAAGAVGGSLIGVIGAVRPIRTMDPAKGLADAVRDMTPDQLIEQAAKQSPIHSAAAADALIPPSERIPPGRMAVYEGEMQDYVVPAPKGIGPAIPDDHVRLYRFEGGGRGDTTTPAYMQDTPEYRALASSFGRWFTANWNDAQFYANDAGPGAKLWYVDVPKAELEQHRVSNIPLKEAEGTSPRQIPENPAAFSALPDREFFVSREIANKRREIDLSATSPDEVRSQIAELTPSYETAHDLLRFFKAMSPDILTSILKDPSGALSLFHGTGVVFAAQLGAPFGRFQLQKVGAGEGQQLFSWGLYFAQDQKIAGWYRDADLKRKGTDEGALFTVKVDVEPHQLLDWDTKLGEQPKAVQDALAKALGEWGKAHADTLPEMSGEALFKRLMQEKGATVAETAAMTGEGNRKASEALLAEGVKGMRYLAGRMAGAAQEGNYNHVIYDPRVISITHRNGEAVRLTPFSLLMPILEGPIHRMGAVADALTANLRWRRPVDIVKHHLNQAARDNAQQEIIKNVGVGERQLADFATSLDRFDHLLSPHMTEWERAVASKDPAKMQNSVIGNFIAYIEGVSNGATLADSKLQPLADMMRLVNMDMYERLAGASYQGKINTPGFIEDYFRHIWKDPRGPEWEALLGRYGVGKTGSTQGLKERSVPTMMEGLAAGLIPKIAHPVDLMMYDLGQKVRYLASRDIVINAKEAGFAYTAATRRDPNDVELRNTRMEVGPGQSVSTWAPKGFAKPYNNWLDAGLYGHPDTATRYEQLLWMTNTMTGMKLAFPTFHAMVVGLGSWSSAFGQGMQEFGRGQLGASAMSFGKAATIFGPVISHGITGTRMIREYARMTNDPVINLLAENGLRFGSRQSVYRFGPESFQKTSQRGTDVDLPIVGGVFTKGGMREIWRALSHDFAKIAGDPDAEGPGQRFAYGIPRAVIKFPLTVLGRVMNSVTDPLFDHAIPALKVGAGYQRLSSWLDANRTASPEAKGMMARQIVKDLDNRYGELNQDTLFWRQSVKQTANLALISTGWVYGTYRGLFGAMGLDIERGQFRFDPTVTASTIGTVVGFAYANAVLQYLLTRKAPWETGTPWQDLMNYRTGKPSQWGTPERGMVPSELKESFDLFHLISRAVAMGAPSQIGPAFAEYAMAKNNPFWQVIHTLMTGEDGIGHKIAFTPGGWTKYFADLFNPIVANALMHPRVGTGIDPMQKLFGLKEAARYIEDNAGYVTSMGKLADRWTKEELSRAGKEALLLGEEAPAGYRPPGSSRGGGGGGFTRSATPSVASAAGLYGGGGARQLFSQPAAPAPPDVPDTTGAAPVYRGGGSGGSGRRVSVPRARAPRPALLPARLRTRNRRGR